MKSNFVINFLWSELYFKIEIQLLRYFHFCTFFARTNKLTFFAFHIILLLYSQTAGNT